LVNDLHLFVQPTLFRQIADLVQALALKRLAKKIDLAGIGRSDADHHADGTGLSGAVWPQQTENASLRNAEGEVIYGDKLVVRFTDVNEFNCLH
jgi:hypothetical protein